jgi:hypothetical protein
MRWSYLAALTAVVVLVVGAAIALTVSRGDHVPRRHGPSDDGSPTPSIELPPGHTPPEGGWPHG